jgi:transcriptional regulator GlxA family with amidase domain
LRACAPSTNVVSDRRFVDNGKIVTAAGVSAGIDAALYVVERLLGKSVAMETARNMAYAWEGHGD